MRLIDADAIDINEECTFSGKGIKAFLDAIPAAYDVDKVVERLEEMRDTITHNISLNSQGENVDEEILNEISHYQKIIGIVKSGGIE